MRAIMTCVDFADIAALTIPHNREHFSEVWVVTSRSDHATMKVANDNNCHIVTTDKFWDGGAAFNKWVALEHGLDLMGRKGRLAILDVDVLWPTEAAFPFSTPGKLCTPRRRMLTDLTSLNDGIPPEGEWGKFPLHPQQQEFAGYTQVFWAEDEHLGPPPWHDVTWAHCGGADSAFQAKWPEHRKVRPDWECLHLGGSGENWCGRVSSYLDGTAPPEASQRSEQLRRFMKVRRATRSFDCEKIKPIP